MGQKSVVNFQGVILIAILYIYIFNPVFIIPGFGLNNLLLLFAGVYCVINRKVFFRDILLYRRELVLITLMIIYLLVIVTMTGGGYYEGVTALFGYFTTLLFLPIFLVHALISKVKTQGFFNIMISVGLVAATISILCLLFPGFNMFIRGIQSGEEMESVEDLGLSLLRSFGLGGNLTSAYGYMMGLFSAYCVLKINRVNKWYYLLFSIVFFVAAIINARTGVFPFFIALIFILFRSLRKFSIKYLLIIGMFVLAGIIAFNYLERKNPEMYDYLYGFFTFFSSSNNFEQSSYSRMWFFPETLQGLIFGEGRNVFGIGDNPNSSVGTTSDIGFVRNVFLGGIVFLFLLLIEQFTLFRNMYKRSGKELFVLVLGLSVLIFHFKGSLCYITTAVSRFVLLFYFVLVYNTRNKKNPIILLRGERISSHAKRHKRKGANRKLGPLGRQPVPSVQNQVVEEALVNR